MRPLLPACCLLWCLSRIAIAQEPIFQPGAELKIETAEGRGGEGPTWHPQLGVLSTGRGNINRFDRDGKASTHRERAGANGLLFDAQGRLLACEPRGITRQAADGAVEVLSDNYEGKRYNRPNDLCLDSRGRIYFTDPRYGNRQGMEILDVEGRPIEGVYRIDLDSADSGAEKDDPAEKSSLSPGERAGVRVPRVTRIIGRELDRPNGILVSPDDRYLFVADNNNNNVDGARKLWRFDLRPDGTVDFATRKLLRDWSPGRGPDGLKQDQLGRLYVAAGLNQPKPPFEPAEDVKGGIYVLSPDDGRQLAFLTVPTDEVTNCCFGGDDLKTLYITGGGTLYSIRTVTPGRVVYPPPTK